MTCMLQLGLALCAVFLVFAAAQDPTVSLTGVQDLSESVRFVHGFVVFC